MDIIKTILLMMTIYGIVVPENNFFLSRTTSVQKKSLKLFHGSCKDTILRFNNMDLPRLDHHSIESSQTLCVTLNNNSITKISRTAFELAPNVKFLDVSNNQIPKENLLSIYGIENVEILILDNQREKENRSRRAEHSRNHSKFPNLKQLHLRSNRLENQLFLRNLNIVSPKLTHLHLTNNQIHQSMNILNNLPSNLTHIDLDDNLIKGMKIHKNMKNIIHMNLNGNRIIDICNKICSKLDSLILDEPDVRLSHLYMSRNRITEIHSLAFANAVYLKYLYLSSNRITSIADDAFRFSYHLEYLYLDNNLLKFVPNIKRLSRLKNLVLSHNSIKEISNGTFWNLIFLRSLNLSWNSIEMINSNAFGNLTSLEYLDLSHNRLSRFFPNWFVNSQLKVLRVHGNYFTTIENLILDSKLSVLTNLFVDSEKIESFNISRFIKSHYTNLTMNFVHGSKENILTQVGCSKVTTKLEQCQDKLKLNEIYDY